MDVIQSANKQVDKFGAGKHGFSAGNPTGGIPATFFTPDWCDNIQQEIVNVIEGAGIALNPGSQTQLFQAIQAIYAGASGNDYKASVRVATTGGNISLTGGAPNALDGVSLAANDRILVKDQATPSQNGLYYVATLGTGANGTWARVADADGAGELTSGALVSVEAGSTLFDSLWMLTTDGTITIGATALTFARKDPGAAAAYPIGGIFDFAGTTAPAGTLACPTAATNISRTTYAALFAAIGTTWGAGDGSTTFGMPWFPADYAAVQANGNVGSSTAGQVIAHTHTFTNYVDNASAGTNSRSTSSTSVNGSQATDSTGGSGNLAAGVRVLKCVKY